MSYINSNWWELNYTGNFQVRTLSDRLIASCDNAETAEEIAKKGRARMVWAWNHTDTIWPFRRMYIVHHASAATKSVARKAGFFAKAK